MEFLLKDSEFMYNWRKYFDYFGTFVETFFVELFSSRHSN